ncbi:hypothetical protein QHF89_09275 [Polyangium sorediatum]|uniref:Uncharacterized protein n=1 Tax=Polyangium sorediatum TaxID=889274 RepID=A0ABT6NMY9_9BACT|nr:hypothetical protein [Polyangium sorediatum]MDI1429687.1 hypothetical protein [Polyangium sorediatum]
MKSGLPPGVSTVLERAPAGAVTYLGDARLVLLLAGERRLVRLVDHAPVIRVIGPYALERRILPMSFPQQWHGPITILRRCRCDQHAEEHPHDVDEKMTFSPVHLFLHRSPLGRRRLLL